MLSSTADHLFWMARYTERAENTARMLDIHLQSALLAGGRTDAQREQAARAMLTISELEPAFSVSNTTLTSAAVLRYMVSDQQNGSSIASALFAARENARAVRGAITTELFETINVTWLGLQTRLLDNAWEKDQADFFAWVKHRAHLTRGVTSGTMPRDDAYRFVAIGTALERADNVARLLDVKFHEADVSRTQDWDVKGEYYHWAAILRSVSGFEIYRKTYRDTITPSRVAELLILRADMPRSLLAAMNALCNQLENVANTRSGDTLRCAGLLRAQIQFARIDDILSRGLHAYLQEFLERVDEVGKRISRDFLVN
jgi:uncharacterized alpha-E superfamily protein